MPTLETSESVNDSLSSLRYDYNVDSFDESTHYGRLLRRVGRNKRVLELGSSTGFLTDAMVGQFGCTVTGVEIDEDAAAAARAKGQEVFVWDLDKTNLTEALAGRQFDVVLCADVLEHLRDPGQTLKQLCPLLADGGQIICSIPHVAHADIKVSLLTGRLPYRPVGLLDHTHMKFFTRALLEEVFEDAGLKVCRVERNRWGATRTEVQGRIPSALAGLSDFLAADPESETYQFIVTAEPYTASSNSAESTAKAAPTARVDVVVIDQDSACADDLYQKYLTKMHYPAELVRFWFVSETGGLSLADKPSPEPARYEDSDFRTFRFAGATGAGDTTMARPAMVVSPSINRRAAGINIATSLAQVAQGSDAEYLFVLLANALPGANCLAEMVRAAASDKTAIIAARAEIAADGAEAPADYEDPGFRPIAWHGFSGLLIPREFLKELKAIDPNLWTAEGQAADMCFRAWATGHRVLECSSANYFSNGPINLPGDYDDTVADGLRLRRRWGTVRNIVAFARYCFGQFGGGRPLVALKTANHALAAMMIETPLAGALSEEAQGLVGFTGAGASVIGRRL